MKKLLLKLFGLFIFSAVISSCVRSLDGTADTKISDVTIPADFNWSSLTTAQLTVIPADTYSGDYYYVIEVFGENPILNASAPLLAKGVANKGKSFIADLALPTSTSTVYVRQTNPLKGQVIQSVAVSGSNLVCNFNPTVLADAQAMPAITSLRSASAVVEDPTPAGATVLTSASGDISWTNSGTNLVVKTGESFAGSVALGNNSALYVEGEYKVAGNKTLTMGSGSKLVIQNGGNIQFSAQRDLQFDANTQIKNYGEIKATNTLSFTNNALFYNYGSFDGVKVSATNTAAIINDGSFSSNNSVELTSSAKLFNTGKIDFNDFSTTNSACTVSNKGEFNAQDINIASAPFSNEGSLNVAKTLQLASACSLQNTGAIVTKDLTTDSGAKIFNNCHILVTRNFDATGLTAFLYNESLIKTATLVSDGSTFQMDGGAILEAEDAEFTTWRNYIKGGTGYGLARLKSIQPQKSKNLSSNITFEGMVEVECTDLMPNPQYNTFYVVQGSDVRWAKTGESTTTIAASDCNSGGNSGTKSGEIPGGGGVVTPPANPDFPVVVNLTTNYSFIMEDNWPFLGDYDLNDLVVDLTISYLQNSDNKATHMIVAYKLRAVGAMKSIGAAFQLDKVVPEQISGVSYSTSVLTGGVFATEKGGLETGQSKAVIPMFDEAHVFSGGASGMLNTIIGGASFVPKSDTVTIAFNTPINPSDISISNLNFFIVTDGSANVASRTEVHLPGFEPTDKMDATLFGTADDASSVAGKYRTANNLIWGLLIPTSFNYASEWKDVTSVYPQFAGWCTSGGVENSYWYLNPTEKSGYVYNAK